MNRSQNIGPAVAGSARPAPPPLNYHPSTPQIASRVTCLPRLYIPVHMHPSAGYYLVNSQQIDAYEPIYATMQEIVCLLL